MFLGKVKDLANLQRDFPLREASFCIRKRTFLSTQLTEAYSTMTTDPSSCYELTVLDLVPFGHRGSHPRFFALRLSRPAWKSWQPGQFVMLRPDSFGLQYPWGRPLGICLMRDEYLVCFFQVVGRGTELIAKLKPKEKVMLWGPLGHGFAIEENTPTLLLAGGMGIVPFIGYVEKHPQPWNVSMLFGHRESLDCYPVDSLNEHIPVDTLHETVPGDLDNFIFTLQERIKEYSSQNGLILACGPMPFLKTVHNFAKEFKARVQLSLENKMACGVGACLGCVVKSTDSWPDPERRNTPVSCCTKGPVFWADQIEL